MVKTATAAVSAAALLLVLVGPACVSAVDLMAECPGNLLTNAGFEEPNTETTGADKLKEPNVNSKWGWYTKIPGWYTTRPDGQACARVDWCGTCEHYGVRAIEIARGALAKPPEGMQYAELLPNATGTYCQDVAVQKGAQYRLTFYYGRLVTYKTPGGGTHGYGTMTAFETALDVAIRPADYTPNAAARSIWPGDRQGFTVLTTADTQEQWARTKQQWVRHETTFTAPSDVITLAFINAKRPKECGSCGSLLDAVCLRKI